MKIDSLTKEFEHERISLQTQLKDLQTSKHNLEREIDQLVKKIEDCNQITLQT